MSTEKCFCHLNGYAVKDATARKQMPLIAQTIIEFQKFTYQDLFNKFNAKEELSEGLAEKWFNKPVVAGERFFAVATTYDKITVGITAEVIRLGSTGTVHFKLLDLVILYIAPLMFLYTLEPPASAETLLKGGYKNSAPVSGFNRRPLAGELFYTTLKTPYGDVLTMTARLTGEYATNENGEEFAVFESVEIIQIHSGTDTGTGETVTKTHYYHTLKCSNATTGANAYVTFVSLYPAAFTKEKLTTLFTTYNYNNMRAMACNGHMKTQAVTITNILSMFQTQGNLYVKGVTLTGDIIDCPFEEYFDTYNDHVQEIKL